MPDDFEAQQDLEILLAADRIAASKGRVGRARQFAERKSKEMQGVAENMRGRAPPPTGSPRETSFKPKTKGK